MRKIDTADRALWSQFKNGDRKSFSLIYQQNIAALINYGLKIYDDTTILKDIIQDLFVELWNSRSNLADVDSIKFYLFKALRFKLIRLERKQFASTRLAATLREHTKETMDMSAEDKIIGEEAQENQTELLQNAIMSLSNRQKEAIQLRFYQGFTHEQIAELMQLNYQSVSNLLYTAILRIREKLKAPILINEYAVYR
jgi:RNA polymerase sigma factor (sigma-70 family)